MITGLYAGILGFMLLALLFRIMSRRLKYRVGLGDGGVSDLGQAIRVHGNFIEIVPIILIIMALMELGSMPGWFLHIYGVALVVSRLLHAWGITTSPYKSFGRQYGILLSCVLIAVGSAVLIFMYIK